MNPYARVAVKKGIVQILSNFAEAGLMVELQKSLQNALTKYLVELKDKSVINLDTQTGVEVHMSPELENAISVARDRQELMSEYALASGNLEQHEGMWKCPSCEFENNYTSIDLEAIGEAPECMLCGEVMEFDSFKDYNPFNGFENVMSLEIHFDEPWIEDMMQDIRNESKDQIEKMNDAMIHAMSDIKEMVKIKTSLEALYLSPMNKKLVWDKLLKCVDSNPHPDHWFKVKAWAYRLALAYGVVKDISFEIHPGSWGQYGIEMTADRNTDATGETVSMEEPIAHSSMCLAYDLAAELARSIEESGPKETVATDLMYLLKMARKDMTMSRKIVDCLRNSKNPDEELKEDKDYTVEILLSELEDY